MFDGKLFGEQIVAAIKSTLGLRISEVERRLDALETQASQALSYAGIFSRSPAYSRNTLVTHNGSLWISVRDTCNEAPITSDAWVLVSKNGAHSMTGASARLHASGAP